MTLTLRKLSDPTGLALSVRLSYLDSVKLTCVDYSRKVVSGSKRTSAVHIAVRVMTRNWRLSCSDVRPRE
jgi:hypothetical protein